MERSAVEGRVEDDERSDIEKGIGEASDGGGVGSSKVARCACKQDSSACRLTTYSEHHNSITPHQFV